MRLALALSLTLLAAAPASASAAPLKFEGTWYEQARFPEKIGNDCQDVRAEARPGSDPMRIEIVCYARPNARDVQLVLAGRTLVKGGADVLKLRWKIFSKEFRIFRRGPSDRWLLLGTPDHHHLFIASRDAKLPKAELDRIIAAAKAMGFDTSRLLLRVRSA